MVDQYHHNVLVLGYGEANVTFLNRLFQGLMESGCEIYIASTKCYEKKSSLYRSQYCLWTPSIKGWRFGKWAYLIYCVLFSFATKRLGWLKTQISKGKSFKEKLGIFVRYAPFCRDAFDIIYFPWNSTAIAYRGLFELGIPTIISCRGTQINISPHLPSQGAYVSGLIDTLQNASAVHCVSEDIRQAVLKIGVTKLNLTVIRPAVDPKFFTPPSQTQRNQRFTLVTTASLTWGKSFETLLVALKHLLQFCDDAELHIIGNGPERQHILFTIYDLGIQDHVFLHGRLKPNQVRDQLQNGDTFVLSSLSEGISNAVLEAMSCGLPIITTDCGGMREAVTNGVEGFVVPIRDPQMMADAMHKLAINPDMRAKMGAAGRRRVRSCYHINHQINDFLELFQTLILNDHVSESNHT